MKLIDAIEIAEACGLKTIGESLLNIRMHSIQMFPYDKINEEELELNNEYKDIERKYGINYDSEIGEVKSLLLKK